MTKHILFITVNLSENESVIFGKITFVENGVERLLDRVFGPSCVLFHEETGKIVFVGHLEERGYFYWIVPTGSYVIRDVDIGGNLIDTAPIHFVQPQIAFHIPLGGRIFYLGTLKIDIDTSTFIARKKIKTINDIQVLNEFEEAEKAFRARYQVINHKIEMNLSTKITNKSPMITRKRSVVYEAHDAVCLGATVGACLSPRF
jgi:hypothetical protein